MANGFGHPGQPPEGAPDRWSPPRPMQRPRPPDDGRAPGWGPMGDQGPDREFDQEADYGEYPQHTRPQQYPADPPYPPPRQYPPQRGYPPQRQYHQQPYPAPPTETTGQRRYPPPPPRMTSPIPRTTGEQPYQPAWSAPAGYPPSRRAPMDDMLQALPEATESPRGPRRGFGRVLLSILVTISLLTGLGLAAIYVKRHHGGDPVVTMTGRPVTLPAGDPIISQTTDPKPLTTTEVFGHPTIKPDGSSTGYTLLKAQVVTNCSSVATDKIAAMLTSLGCTQAVRGTLRSADGVYVVTSGIVNLPDATKAASARTSVASLITANSGHFIGLDAAGGVTLVTTHLGWDARGHYLFFAVIALASGKPITADDAGTDMIIDDVIEKYLSGTIIAAREPARSASPTPSR